MQVSLIKDDKAKSNIYLRSKIKPNQQTICDKLKLKVLNDKIPQSALNQYFTK
jgi:hypothetical protein